MSSQVLLKIVYIQMKCSKGEWWVFD